MEDLKSFSGHEGIRPFYKKATEIIRLDECLSVSDELFGLFQNLIYRVAGIRLNSQKRGLLVSRLMRRLKKLGINDLHEYYKKLKNDSDELVEMLNCISTNTTHFFRENHHFDYLKNKIMPELLKIQSFKEKTIRIWSAGCSTGEEPYSIAISVYETLKEFVVKGSELWDIKILATDISTKALDAAQRGIYEYEAVSEMPEDIVRRYFLKGTMENIGKIKVKDFLKDMIRFRRLNLKDMVYPFNRAFDVIFCRNVMIYFDEDMKQHVLSMFHKHLTDEGYLFLGHSETMFGNNRFKPVFITTYKKQA